MKKLFIVESPRKARTIQKYLTNEFTVISTMGHIKDLPKKKIGIQIEKDSIHVDYEILEGKEKIIKEIKKQALKAEEIFLAPDPDREGEIIAFHINEIINEEKKNQRKAIYRITSNEISKQAIIKSLENKKEINQSMVKAQQARRILDRLVGYKVSPVLWKKIKKGLSAGRVQSIALRLICERDKEISTFISEEYWSIHGKIKDTEIQVTITPKGLKKKTELSAKKAHIIYDSLPQQSWHVSDIQNREKKRRPYAPFITSTLQQAASTQLGYDAQKTMKIAQELYEGVTFEGEDSIALITYMRTDSPRISKDARHEADKFITSTLGKEYLPKKPHVYSAKENTQDAHEAIRPIDITITPSKAKPFLSKELFNLYELIWNRFVASQMSEAVYSTRSVTITNNDGTLVGKATGSVLIFAGFLKIYKAKDSDGEFDHATLPENVSLNQKVSLTDFQKKQHFTQPPARFSEARLIKELEEKHIGRPSTYVPILRTIRDRLYTELDEKKKFLATTLGQTVCAMLIDNMPNIMNYSFTANLEKELDEISQGKRERDDLIHTFYDSLIAAVKKFLDIKVEKNYEKTNIPCPNCEELLLVKESRIGKFLGCPTFPKCKFTSNFERDGEGNIIIKQTENNKKNEKTLSIKCEKCQEPMCIREGKHGDFIACSGYPKCKEILPEKTKALCPSCNTYQLHKRIWKGNIFWGCLGYPKKCSFSINGDIIEEICKICNFPFMKKKNGECANKLCPSKENNT
jgi:DNA topoisomerase-1